MATVAARQNEEEQQLKFFQEYAAQYPVTLAGPPLIFSKEQVDRARIAGGEGAYRHYFSSTTKDDRKPFQTTPYFVRRQLQQAGLLLTTPANEVKEQPPMALEETMERLNWFVQSMEGTGCYHSVQVQLVPVETSETAAAKANDRSGAGKQPQASSSSSSSFFPVSTTAQIQIILDEKKWYKLQAGASMNAMNQQQSTWSSTSTGSNSGDGSGFWSGLGGAEVEMSAGMRNLWGMGDSTDWTYAIQATPGSSSSSSPTGIPSWSWMHQRPIYMEWQNDETQQQQEDENTTNNNYTPSTILFPMMFSTKLFLTTLDYQATRSYQEYQRGFWAKIASAPSFPSPPLEWSIMFQALLRDIIPKRSTSPDNLYAMEASIPIVQQAGPNFKQSIIAQLQNKKQPPSSSQSTDPSLSSAFPHVDWTLSSELAMPDLLWLPFFGSESDVSFLKNNFNWCWHYPIHASSTAAVADVGESANPPLPLLTLHSLLNIGYMYDLRKFMGSNTQPVGSSGGGVGGINISDRFFLGGPLPFRGFLPSGIGPRAAANRGRGDALGGDFYYTWTPMISFPLLFGSSDESPSPSSSPFQAFVFGTVGTCVGSLSHVFQQQQQALAAQPPEESSSSDIPAWLAPYTSTAQAVLMSSRSSVGCGISTTVAGNVRLEATYAIPVRYGPDDLRRTVQWGISMNLNQ